jgi:hypothetical protein
VGDRTVAASFAVDVVVLGEVVRPMLQVVRHGHLPLRKVDKEPTSPCGGSAATARRPVQADDRTGDNDAWTNPGVDERLGPPDHDGPTTAGCGPHHGDRRDQETVDTGWGDTTDG